MEAASTKPNTFTASLRFCPMSSKWSSVFPPRGGEKTKPKKLVFFHFGIHNADTGDLTNFQLGTAVFITATQNRSSQFILSGIWKVTGLTSHPEKLGEVRQIKQYTRLPSIIQYTRFSSWKQHRALTYTHEFLFTNLWTSYGIGWDASQVCEVVLWAGATCSLRATRGPQLFFFWWPQWLNTLPIKMWH